MQYKVMQYMTISVVVMCIFAGISLGATRLNAVTGKAETVPDGSDNWTTKINPVTGEASIQPPDAKVEMNAVTGKAEWDSGHNPDETE